MVTDTTNNDDDHYRLADGEVVTVRFRTDSNGSTPSFTDIEVKPLSLRARLRLRWWEFKRRLRRYL